MRATTKARTLLLLAALVLPVACSVDDPGLKTVQTWMCVEDTDCLEGFVCISGLCDKEEPTLGCDDRDEDGKSAGPECPEPAYDADGDGQIDQACRDAWPRCQDCDDHSKAVYPGAPESCNGVDDDCDGDTDEETNRVCQLTTGVCAAAVATQVCTDGVLVPADCRDGCPGASCIYGATYAIEEGNTHCDGSDNDCDGETDELCPTCTANETCGIVCIGDVPEASCACKSGPWQQCNPDGSKGECVDPSTGVKVLLPFQSNEICGDGLDNDCTGQVDENCP